MAETFSAISNERRGALLRVLLTDDKVVALLPADDAAVDFDAQNLTQGLGIGTVNNLPTAANVRNLRSFLQTSGLIDTLIGKTVFLANSELGSRFGDRNLTIGAQQAVQAISDLNTEEASRKLGFRTEERTLNRKLQAVTDPLRFIQDKNNDIQRINNLAIQGYNESYQKFREFGYSQDDAFDRAKKSATVLRENLMKQHMIEFPVSLENEAKNKIVKTIN